MNGTLGYTGKLEYLTKDAAMADAREAQRNEGRPYYVLRLLYTDRLGDWAITEKMPLCGEWYSTDGIRHG